MAEREKIPTLKPELGNTSVGKCVDFYLPITDIQVMGYIFAGGNYNEKVEY